MKNPLLEGHTEVLHKQGTNTDMNHRFCVSNDVHKFTFIIFIRLPVIPRRNNKSAHVLSEEVHNVLLRLEKRK